MAGMPFLLLVGAAPNAIAYESKQFSTGQFFVAGIPASVVLTIVLGIFVWLIWPLMGMPVTIERVQPTEPTAVYKPEIDKLELHWHRAWEDGDEAYRIQLGSDSVFGAIKYEDTTSKQTIAIPSLMLEKDQLYFLRIRAYNDEQKDSSEYSEPIEIRLQAP
jgi:hypothetical protein